MEPLRRIAVALAGSKRVWDSVSARYDGWATPGSQAAAEMAFDDPLGPRVRDALSGPGVQLQAALVYMVSLDRLVEDPPMHFAMGALARTCIEVAASVFWVEDASLAAEERAHRGLRMRLTDLSHARTAAQDLGSEHLEDLDRIIRRLRSQARDLGIESLAEAPNYTDRAGYASNASGYGRSRGQALYRHLAGISHGNPVMLLTAYERSDRQPLGDVEMVTWSEAERPLHLAGMMTYAFLAASQAVANRMTLFGWDASDWDRWWAHAQSEIGRALEDPDLGPDASD